MNKMRVKMLRSRHQKKAEREREKERGETGVCVSCSGLSALKMLKEARMII